MTPLLPPATDLPVGAQCGTLVAGAVRLVAEYPADIEAISRELAGLPCVVLPVSDWRAQPAACSLRLLRPCWVILSVHDHGNAGLDPSWRPLPHGLLWRFRGAEGYRSDRLVARFHAAGLMEIPGHQGAVQRRRPPRPHLIILADRLPDPPAAGQDALGLLAAFTRIETVELTLGDLTATVQTHPGLRLTAFTDGRVPSLLATAGCTPAGVRTWFMEPEQNDASPLIASRPAVCLDHGAGHGRFHVTGSVATALDLDWEVRLDASRRSLHLTHLLTNRAGSARTIAVWSLAVGCEPLAMRAMLWRDPGSTAPARRIRPPGPTGRYRVHFEDLTPGLPGVDDQPEWLTLTPQLGTDPLKAGLRAHAGVAALVRGDQALVSRVLAPPPGDFPEGGHNLTAYSSEDILEIEHVGPLLPLPPGGCVRLDQELRLADLRIVPLTGLPDLFADG